MRNTGGPAYPGFQHTEGHGQCKIAPAAEGATFQWYEPGMTLRDHFAAAAMQVEISTACHSLKNAQALVGAAAGARRTIEQQIAHNAYSMADAMLAERAKP